MKTSPTDSDFPLRIRDALNQGTASLDQRATLRLYEARCDALRHQSAPVAVLGLAGFGHTVSDTLHRHYRGILALIALAIGAMAVDVWQNLQQAEETAEIDSAILSDEVPPTAYTDQDFQEWLNRRSESERDSSPE